MRPPLMSVEIRGVEYPSVEAASEALRVKPGTVYGALARGRAATCGTAPYRARQDHHNAKPFNLGPYRFPTMGAASEALGFHRAYLRDVLRSGGKLARAKLDRAICEYIADREKAEKTTQ